MNQNRINGGLLAPMFIKKKVLMALNLRFFGRNVNVSALPCCNI